MKSIRFAFTLCMMALILTNCGGGEDGEKKDQKDASLDGALDDTSIAKGGSGGSSGKGGASGSEGTAGKGGDDGVQSCPYDCVPESFCTNAGGKLFDEMNCSESSEVCCSLKDECTFDCISEADCTSQDGTPQTDMVCADQGTICCQVLPVCEYDCVPTSYCNGSDGLAHTDQRCESGDDVCCEIDPVCIYDCVPEAFCTGATGTIHDNMTCEDETDVCCEPGQSFCEYPNACLPSGDCDTADRKSGECQNTSHVCCVVDRCEDNGGTCRTGNPVFQCFGTEHIDNQYFCTGNQNCCVLN